MSSSFAVATVSGARTRRQGRAVGTLATMGVTTRRRGRGARDRGRREEISKSVFDHVVDVAIAKKKIFFAPPHDLRAPINECELSMFEEEHGIYLSARERPKTNG